MPDRLKQQNRTLARAGLCIGEGRRFKATSAVMAAWTLSLACTLSCQPYVAAADFSQAQHTYVPPSLYERRIDFNQSREDDAVGTYASEHHGAKPKLNLKGSATHFEKKHPYGKLPAPPSVASSAEKGSKASKTTVPPPPPYSATLAGTAKDLRDQVHKALSSPQVKSAFAELKKQAEEYARSGKLNEAKHAVAKALQLSPHDKQLLRELGTLSVEKAKLFSQSDNVEKATQFARQALAFDGGNPDARKMLDGLLQKTGINPADHEQRLKTADLLASQGKNDEAWVEYQAANRLKPTADGYIGLGNVALRSGQKGMAKSEYQAAEEIDPSSAGAHRQLGLLKLNQNDIVGANSELSRALILNPKDKDAAHSLVELWQNQVYRVPGANSHLGLARAYQLAGDLQSAQAEYREVVRIDPENPNLSAARQSFKLALARQEADQAADAARTLESQGAIQDAYQKAYEAVRMSPGDADLRLYQGHLLEQMKRYGAAKEAYLAALRINPHNVMAAARIKALPQTTDVSAANALAAPPNAMAAANAPALKPPIATPSPDGVNNISNFALALRNQMLTQKNQIQKVEDVAHDMIASIGKTPPSEALVSGGLPADLRPAISSASSTSTAGTDALGDSVQSALAKAKAAIAAAGGKSAAPVAASAASSEAASSAAAASTSTASAAASSAASALPYSTAELNQALGAAPLVSADPLVATTTAQSSNTEPVPSDSAALALPYVPTQSSAQTSDVEPPLAPPIVRQSAPVPPPVASSFAPGAMPHSSNDSPYAPNAIPPAAGNQLPALRTALPLDESTVSLQLLGASPKVAGVELSVVLRNDADTELSIPKNVRGVIKYSNRKDADVKIEFKESSVPPHGATKGLIRVPYDKADPTADLLIPGLLPAGSRVRDIHLTTKIASR